MEETEKQIQELKLQIVKLENKVQTLENKIPHLVSVWTTFTFTFAVASLVYVLAKR